MKVIGWIAGVVLGLLLLAGLAAAFVAHTSTGRAWLADTMASNASAESRGTVTIDSIEEVGFDRLVIAGYRLVAPNGETVIEVERMSGDPVVSELLTGKLRLLDGRFERATIHLTSGPGGQVNLVYASEVPDDRAATPLIFEDIELVQNRIVVDLPGKPKMNLTEISGLAHLEIGHRFLWRLDQTKGKVDLPIIGDRPFYKMHGRLKSDHAHPLLVEMAVDLSIAEPVANLDYHVPAIGGQEGEAYFDLDLPDGIFAGGDRDADDRDDGGPAPGGTRQVDADEDIDEDVDEDADESIDEGNDG